MSRLKKFFSIFRKSKKPSCYGHYFDSTPSTARNLKLGCDKCPYWSYNKEKNCMIDSITPKPPIHPMNRTRTEPTLAVDQDIGRHMKVHGRQSKEYRKSILKKVRGGKRGLSDVMQVWKDAEDYEDSLITFWFDRKREEKD